MELSAVSYQPLRHVSAYKKNCNQKRATLPILVAAYYCFTSLNIFEFLPSLYVSQYMPEPSEERLLKLMRW